MDQQGERKTVLISSEEEQKRQARFVEAVKRGIASAERGDFIEHEEVLARIERLLHA